MCRRIYESISAKQWIYRWRKKTVLQVKKKTFNFLPDMSFNTDFLVAHERFWRFSDHCQILRCEWRMYNYQVPTMHAKYQEKNMVPRKAEVRSWGHYGIGKILRNIVKLSRLHRRLTSQKMPTYNPSLESEMFLRILGIRCEPFSKAPGAFMLQNR